jgi:hypothetical protein
MRFAMPVPRSLQRSATAAVSGCTAERHDKSIITRFVHNAVEKSVRKTDPTESHAFSGILHFKEKIMFENQKFLTSGVQNEIPSWLIDLIWCMVFSMKTEHKDYLQVFTLTKTPAGQHIVHEQEQPLYRYELDVPCDDAVNAKVFVIDDLTHSTMLLAEEY